MAHFTASANLVHDTTANLFGESASWTPSAGGSAQVVQVNFNNPDKSQALGDLSAMDWEFTALDTWIEYRVNQFPGLVEAVANKTPETIVLTDQNGAALGSFRVTKTMRVWDGHTIKAQIILIP